MALPLGLPFSEAVNTSERAGDSLVRLTTHRYALTSFLKILKACQ
jgi:hypothetical protein